MKALVPFILLFCFLATGPASAQDAFDLLFGAEPEAVDAGTGSAAGQDDLLLVGLRLRGLKLASAIPAYQVKEDICLPFSVVAELLEIDADISKNRITGWYVTQTRTFEIDLDRNSVLLTSGQLDILDADITGSSEGACLTLSLLSRFLPIDFTYQSSTLSVRAEPRETLPLEARLERQAIRNAALSGPRNTAPDYGLLDNPYRWMSAPVFDISVDLKAAASTDLQSAVSLEASGDILKMTGRARTAGSTDMLSENLRLSLERQSPEQDLLGPLNARSFRIGDISVAGLPLIAGGQTGRGFSLSNRPLYAPDYFDMTTIRGPLREGWEAELYRGEQIIDFVDNPTDSGEYLFEGVALMPGYNRLVVRLYGPFGEVEEREIKQFVGADLIPENEFEYQLAFVEAGTSLLGVSEITRESETGTGTNRSGLSVRLDYGLTQSVTLRGDALVSINENPSGAAIAIATGSRETYSLARIATDSEGQWATELAMQRRFSDITSGSLRLRHFRDLSSDIAGAGPARLRSSLDGRLDTQWQLGGQTLPVQINASLQNTVDGQNRSNVDIRTSGLTLGTRWSHTLSWRGSSDIEIDEAAGLNGTFLMSRRSGSLRFKGGLDYCLSNGLTPRNAFISAQTRLNDRSLLQGSFSYDMTSGISRADAAWAQDFDRFSLAGNVGVSSNQNFSAGIKLGFSLYKPDNAGYQVTAPGMGRSGAIRLQAFDDLNENGRFDPGETGMDGAKYIVGNVLRSETADNAGVATLGSIELYRDVNVELQQSSLDDPFMQPVSSGYAVRLRPGQVMDVHVPVTLSADVDGTVLVSGTEDVPVAGVTIQAVDESGRVIAEAKSEYDGYFYIDGLPARPLVLRVAKANLDAVAGQSEAQRIMLSRTVPTATDIKLRITLAESN